MYKQITSVNIGPTTDSYRIYERSSSRIPFKVLE